jgi:hypothetical protein
LQRLFTGDGFPALRHLELSNCAYMPEVLEALATSRLLAQLETLDLSYGFLTGGNLLPLVQHMDRFRHLARFDLSHHQIDPDDVELWQRTFGRAIELSGQFGRDGNPAIRVLG